MKKLGLIVGLLALPVVSFSTGKITKHKDVKAEREFTNVYHGLRGLETRFNHKVLEEVNVVDYGAVGDCEADDTEAFKAALASGKAAVFVPPVPEGSCYKVSELLYVGTSSQTIYGSGDRSKIVQVSTTSEHSGVFWSTAPAVTFRDLYVIPSTSTEHTADGYAFVLQADWNRVTRCRVSNHRRGAVLIYNAAYCTVSENYIHDGAVDPAAEKSNLAGTAIQVYPGGHDNVISGNVLYKYGGIGIAVHAESIANGGIPTYGNAIYGNIVSTGCMYGIMAYSGDVPGNPVTRTTITGNHVRGISGECQDVDLNYYYGAGIYIQGAEESVISGNYVDDTNKYTSIFQLAPAGIGVTNVTNVVITGNIVRNSNDWYGIGVMDPNLSGNTTGFAVISGNSVRDHENGIYVYERGRVSITGNTVDTSRGDGIKIDNTSRNPRYTFFNINGNIVRGSGGAGISVSSGNLTSVQNNVVQGYASYGFTVQDSSYVTVTGNNFLTNNTGGAACLQIGSRTQEVLVATNFCTRESGLSGPYGFIINANAKLYGNKVFGNPTGQNYAGSWAEQRTLTANSTTPSVKDGHVFVTANTASTAYTNFTGGTDGQEIAIIVKDANTTFDFTGTNIKGNGGVDWATPVSSSTAKCVYNETNSLWHCTVQGA